MGGDDSLPDDVEVLKNLLRARDAELGRARAQALSAEALIAHLQLAIEKMRRELYGQRAERKARLLDQMELELEELEAAAAEDELAAGKAAAASGDTTVVRGFTPVLAPLALEAVKKIDAIFDIELELNGLSAEERLSVRRSRTMSLVAGLEDWVRAERAELSRHAETAKAMDYMLKRWASFTRFLDDGRICLTNNAAERALRGIALGRKAWLFAGSDRGGERAAIMYTLIQTARLNGVDPQAWLADVLASVNDHTIQDLDELLPWNWNTRSEKLAA